MLILSVEQVLIVTCIETIIFQKNLFTFFIHFFRRSVDLPGLTSSNPAIFLGRALEIKTATKSQ